LRPAYPLYHTANFTNEGFIRQVFN
jgi:hypothetical protein